MNTRYPVQETRRILLYVNDQPGVDRPLWDWFCARGVAVLRAQTTSRGLDLLGKARVDVVLSDLAREEDGVMNKKAGMDLSRAIRQGGSPVPICIYTNHKDPAVLQLARDAGASYVTESTADLLRWLEQVGP